MSSVAVAVGDTPANPLMLDEQGNIVPNPYTFDESDGIELLGDLVPPTEPAPAEPAPAEPAPIAHENPAARTPEQRAYAAEQHRLWDEAEQAYTILRRQRARAHGAEADRIRAALGRSRARDSPRLVQRRTEREEERERIRLQARPPPLSTERYHQRCAICLDVKSHPVSYQCGHSHCYVCVRLWLEVSWKCPECSAVMHSAPIRHWGEEGGIEFDFPGWKNASVVTYSFDGLYFPAAE
ncbi:hypothetical protein C8R47DRAFT_1222727 [Mycena vitilis]|nr:hypothetical protein C8R47DRAFT_1222727 [Mycena vitilis]